MEDKKILNELLQRELGLIEQLRKSHLAIEAFGGIPQFIVEKTDESLVKFITKIPVENPKDGKTPAGKTPAGKTPTVKTPPDSDSSIESPSTNRYGSPGERNKMLSDDKYKEVDFYICEILGEHKFPLKVDAINQLVKDMKIISELTEEEHYRIVQSRLYTLSVKNFILRVGYGYYKAIPEKKNPISKESDKKTVVLTSVEGYFNLKKRGDTKDLQKYFVKSGRMSAATLYNKLTFLVKNGFIKRTSHGNYELV